MGQSLRGETFERSATALKSLEKIVFYDDDTGSKREAEEGGFAKCLMQV